MPKVKKKKKKSFLATTLSWSDEMEKTFNQTVSVPVLSHESSDVEENIYFGFPFQVLRDEVIEAGRGDFDTDFEHDDYGTLSTEQMAQFYCYTNMKGHFYSAYANFRLSKWHLEDLFDDSEKLVLIDIGCGPGTAGLAFSELFSDRAFDYYGVDRAQAMCDQAERMFVRGQNEGVVNQDTSFSVLTDWADLPRQFDCNASVLLNFSFFFASPFLTKNTIQGLARLYRSINKYAQNRVVVSYTNSHRDIAKTSYEAFLSELGVTYNESPPVQTTVHYCLSRKQKTERTETFRREIFEIVLV